MKLSAYILVLLSLIAPSLKAFTPSESAEISILTTSPGKEIYKIYGHTAIRFQDKEKGKDIVYNYGMFSFDEPHFILRYLQGRNFYLLGREPFKRFNNRYAIGGEYVTQQTLNLSHDELKILLDALEHNARPDNREYLYNVLYDNCATRVYDIVENNLAGGVQWNESCEAASFRELLHSCNKVMPFSQMGIDIVFGPKADKTTSCKEQMFLPAKLMDGFAKAKKSNGEALIRETHTLLEGRKIHNNTEIIVFNIVFALLLVFALWTRFKLPNLLPGFRIVVYSLVGILSLVVFFIAFFSIHPTVLPNLNLIWINPMVLAFAIILLKKKEPSILLQKILNLWSILISLYLILGLAGVYYIHYGLIYIISTLVIISYKRLA